MFLKPLYHYTKSEIAKIIIRTHELKLSIYPKVNDFFDMNKDIIYDPTDENGEKIYNAMCIDTELHRKRPGFLHVSKLKKEDVLSIIREAILESPLKGIISRTPFLCLSAQNDISLMWAHYGDGSRGVVLEFSDDLIKTAEKTYVEEICYEAFEILPSVFNVERTIKILKGDEEEIHKLGRDLLIKKHEVWNYEQEWRFIFNPYANYIEKEDGKFFKFDIKNLTAIYFGLAIDETIVNDISEDLRKQAINHVRLYRMRRNPGYTHIYPEEIQYL